HPIQTEAPAALSIGGERGLRTELAHLGEYGQGGGVGCVGRGGGAVEGRSGVAVHLKRNLVQVAGGAVQAPALDGDIDAWAGAQPAAAGGGGGLAAGGKDQAHEIG